MNLTGTGTAGGVIVGQRKTLTVCTCVPAESIVEAALCKSLLKPLREPIYQSLEKLHTNDSSLKQLAQNQVGASAAALLILLLS